MGQCSTIVYISVRSSGCQRWAPPSSRWRKVHPLSLQKRLLQRKAFSLSVKLVKEKREKSPQACRGIRDFSFHSQAEAVLLGDLQHPLPQVLTGLAKDDGAWQRDGPSIPPLKLLWEVNLWDRPFVPEEIDMNVATSPCVSAWGRGGLTCSMTPMACLWLSNRAGEGAAGSSASVDMLSRTVPITRVLDEQGSEVTPGS